ncbi:hypothetical protein B0H10DRAFT_1960577 [Mycena sp. CBHHK59/15]|nr:hypothetical protein B0H10DRAFT_1960577 [Mycena sp. CBHHK59/15]
MREACTVQWGDGVAGSSTDDITDGSEWHRQCRQQQREYQPRYMVRGSPGGKDDGTEGHDGGTEGVVGSGEDGHRRWSAGMKVVWLRAGKLCAAAHTLSKTVRSTQTLSEIVPEGGAGGGEDAVDGPSGGDGRTRWVRGQWCGKGSMREVKAKMLPQTVAKRVQGQCRQCLWTVSQRVAYGEGSKHWVDSVGQQSGRCTNSSKGGVDVGCGGGGGQRECGDSGEGGQCGTHNMKAWVVLALLQQMMGGMGLDGLCFSSTPPRDLPDLEVTW